MSCLTNKVLKRLVAFDTTNPPRAITVDGVFAYVQDVLRPAGFDLQLTDLGDGCITLLAMRGEPKGLFNVHLDTVPADSQWTVQPFDLRTVGDVAIGLGVCDNKGAAASILAAAMETDGSAALLLTSDEEAGQSRCVRTFVEDVPACFDYVVVAEPTQCKAITAHRGLWTCEGTFTGMARHGSLDAADARNAIHDAARWINAAIDYAAAEDDRQYDCLHGLRLNIGAIRGGVKPNVVASSAHVEFGARPLPDQDGDAVMADLHGLVPDDAYAVWKPRFTAPGLPQCPRAQAVVQELELDAGPAVDFWTEAALFAEAGLPAVVFGPGDIQQAHIANEWISLNQLDEATSTYKRLFSA